MKTLNQVPFKLAQDPLKLDVLLSQYEPFVIKGFKLDHSVYQSILGLLRSEKYQIWSQSHNLDLKLHKLALASTAADNCPCTQLFEEEKINSGDLNSEEEFRLVLPHVAPGSRLDNDVVSPFLKKYLSVLYENPEAYKNMYNSIFMSRGYTRGHNHGHNFDVFTLFPTVGEGTVLYLHPIEEYRSLNAKLLKANDNILTFHATNRDNTKAVCIYEIEPGDIIHIPFCWFHRIDHRGEYLNIATNWHFKNHIRNRFLKVHPHLTEGDYFQLLKESRW